MYKEIAEKINNTYTLKPITGVSLERIIENFALDYFTEDDVRNIINESSTFPAEVIDEIITEIKKELKVGNKVDVQPKKISPVNKISNQMENIGQPETAIPALRTMKSDIDKVHGYGAYRQLYPDAAADEPVHSSSQHDTLARPAIAPLPKYEEEKGGEN